MDTSSEKSSGNDSTTGDDSSQEGFWNKNKKWLKPTLWGAGGLGLLYAGYRFLGGKKQESPPAKAFSGTKKLSEAKSRPKSGKKHHRDKKEVALM